MDFAARNFYSATVCFGGETLPNRQETFADSFSRDNDFLFAIYKFSCGKVNGLA